MNKVFKWIFAIFVIASVFCGVGCKPEVHTHTFAEEWSSDETSHWHAATCGCSDVELKKTEHTFGDWTITKEPTEEAEGSQEKSCSVCGYTVPEVIAKLEHTHKFATDWTSDETNHWHASTCGHEVTEGKTAHTIGDWTTTKEATCTEDGSKTGVCEVCKKEVTEKIDAKGHSLDIWTTTKEPTCTEEGSKTGTCKVCKKEVTEKIDAKGHSYSESRKKDASGHWYECVCGAKKDFEEHTYDIGKVVQEPTCTQEGKKTVYCTVCKYEKEETIPVIEHTFGIWEITKDPTETEVGKKKRECEVCGETVIKDLEGFRFVKGVTITGTESWKPNSYVFVSERKLTIPNLIVSDHEVTRGEYKDVMGSDPSGTRANDKNGKELEGDAVLNNPVNYVYWYDVLVYCNKLSINENLTPCYSIDGSTNPDDWGKVPSEEEDSSRTTWDAVICNWNANGYRLPTEAEWEWLARGGENYRYAGSDDEYKVAWFRYTTNDTGTREVKTKAPNGYGLYDMSGNVYEWCWDWNVYGDNISDSTAADGPTSGDERGLRGGSCFHINYPCEVAYRVCREYPYYRYKYYGFRVVRLAN